MYGKDLCGGAGAGCVERFVEGAGADVRKGFVHGAGADVRKAGLLIECRHIWL